MASPAGEEGITDVSTVSGSSTADDADDSDADSTWTREDGFGFGSWGNTNFVGKDLRVTVPEGEEILPGENWTFSIEVVAPPASFINSFDSFNLPLFKLEWSMIQEDVNWFSNHLFRSIAITCPEDEEE